MKQESKQSLFTNVFFIMLVTVIIMAPIILYGYSKIKSSHDKEVTELKNQICRAYGFDNYEVYTSPFTNESYDECSVKQQGCDGTNYIPLDQLTQNKGVLNQPLGCGGGGPAKAPEEI